MTKLLLIASIWTRIHSITDDIDKVKNIFSKCDADLEPEVRTERLEQANNILDYLVQNSMKLDKITL